MTDFRATVILLVYTACISSFKLEYKYRGYRQVQSSAAPGIQATNSGGTNSPPGGLGSSSSGQLSNKQKPNQFIDPSFSGISGGASGSGSNSGQINIPSFLDPSIFLKGTYGGQTFGGHNPIANGGGNPPSNSSTTGTGGSNTGSVSTSGGSASILNPSNAQLQPPQQFLNPGGSFQGSQSGSQFSFFDPSKFLGK